LAGEEIFFRFALIFTRAREKYFRGGPKLPKKWEKWEIFGIFRDFWPARAILDSHRSEERTGPIEKFCEAAKFGNFQNFFAPQKYFSRFALIFTRGAKKYFCEAAKNSELADFRKFRNFLGPGRADQLDSNREMGKSASGIFT